MQDQNSSEPLFAMYVFETVQNIDQLESSILDSEKSKCYKSNTINEIFRIMHTIKGSSAMMQFNNISILAHAIEDLFYFLREQNPQYVESAALSDLILESIDFIKVELEKIKKRDGVDGDPSVLIKNINAFLMELKRLNPSSDSLENTVVSQKDKGFIDLGETDALHNIYLFKATIYFEDGCGMENIRAFSVIENIKEFSKEIFFLPEDALENSEASQIICERGFTIYFKTEKSYDELHDFFMGVILLKAFELLLLEDDKELRQFTQPRSSQSENGPVPVKEQQRKESSGSEDAKQAESQAAVQSIISVNVAKLDKLMDLMGEMVIAEAMVTQNPDFKGIDHFQKAARQLHKITEEVQDMVMSIRMVPLSTTFHKMHRVVRDMSKKLNKETELRIIGEETEVDKNIIEHISDPLMHLVRNAIDHGIEDEEERKASGKPMTARVTLEAKNAGSDVLVLVKDDGKGLNKEKILKRARENNLILKPEHDMTDREIYNLIFLPGFSTKDSVSEFSGRGVGMDVVVKNIESVGGSVSVDSVEGAGSTVMLKIPLTLAIIDGMNVKVGRSCYTIPTTAIQESFRPQASDLITDPDGNEMIMVRGQCYPILRLHGFYNVETEVTDFHEGIIIMVEQDNRSICIFADRLLGQQQVVVKALPNYIKNTKKIRGLSGCTLLGDGSISLILDIAGLQ